MLYFFIKFPTHISCALLLYLFDINIAFLCILSLKLSEQFYDKFVNTVKISIMHNYKDF